MTLPDIPDETMDAAWSAMKSHGTYEAGLRAAWPHLYAAALRDAAADIDQWVGPAGGGLIVPSQMWADRLREMADAALTEPLLDDGNQPGGQ